MTSSLIQLVASASRASSAVSTASLAVWQPAVLGRKCSLPPSRSTRLSSSPARLMRRTEAVTISVPLAATAASINLRLGYPAEPRNSRYWNVRPAMTSCSDMSATLHHADDLDAIAVIEPRRRPRRAWHHRAIERDRNPARWDLVGLGVHQRGETRRREQLAAAIDLDGRLHRHVSPFIRPPVQARSGRARTARWPGRGCRRAPARRWHRP